MQMERRNVLTNERRKEEFLLIQKYVPTCYSGMGIKTGTFRHFVFYPSWVGIFNLKNRTLFVPFSSELHVYVRNLFLLFSPERMQYRLELKTVHHIFL